jgi:hypothetical protein
MRKILAVGAVLAVASLVVGCIETKQDFTLNPDASGKVVFEFTMADMPFRFGQEGEKPDPELTAKRQVKQMIDGASGIDAWADISYVRTEDGRTRVKGTAYFKDFSQVKFQTSALSGISFAKDDMGGMVLAIDEKVGAGPENPAAPPAPPPATPPAPPNAEELDAKIKADREKFQQMRPILEATIGRMKTDLTFHLPGTLAEVNVFQREPNGAVRLVIDGAKVLEAMDQLALDDAYLKEQALAGRKPGGKMMLDDTMKQKLFGAKGPVRARINGVLKPLFAYDSEVAAAKANYQAMIQRLGLDKLPAPEPNSMPPGFGIDGKGFGVPPAVRPAPGTPTPAPGAKPASPAPGAPAPSGQ